MMPARWRRTKQWGLSWVVAAERRRQRYEAAMPGPYPAVRVLGEGDR